MGAQESSRFQAEATVDGQPVNFVYKRTADGKDAGLTWAAGSKVYGDSERTHVLLQDIIAVVPTPSRKSDYSVLYVEENDAAKGDKQASPYLFKALVASSLPPAFIHDLQSSGDAFWNQRPDVAKSQPNVHVIVSIGSGTGQASSVWERLVKPMLDHVGIEQDKHYTLHFTTSDMTVTELTRDVLLPNANLNVRQSVILLSGDGGVMDIVNTLLSNQQSHVYQKPNVTLLPLGTGNALAHSAGITADNTLGLRTLWQGSPKELPLFCARFSPGARLLVDEGRAERPLRVVDQTPVAYGAVVCSWGLHAGLVADSDTAEYRKFGAERFKMAAKEALFPADGSWPHAYRGRVSVLRSPDAEWELLERDTHGYVLATFCSHLESGFTVSPASEVLDRQLRLVHFGHMSGQDAMEMMTKAYDGGKHVDDARVGYEVIEGLRIEFHEEDSRWRRVCIDGKIVRVEQGGSVEVRVGVQGVLDLIAI